MTRIAVIGIKKRKKIKTAFNGLLDSVALMGLILHRATALRSGKLIK